MDLARARFLAEEISAMLAPVTTRIAIAGGIRREKADPHDLEIVCVPRFERESKVANVLLLSDLPEVNQLELKIRNMMASRILGPGDPDKAGKRAPCGPKYYRLKYAGEKLDLFAVLAPAQWGVVYTIRTGDAEFSHWLVQQGWPRNIKVVDGHLEQNGKVLDTPEERDTFRLLGVEWKEPQDRVTDPRHLGAF